MAEQKTVKVEITTDRKPWVNDAPRAIGDVVENVHEADAETLVKNKFAKIVK